MSRVKMIGKVGAFKTRLRHWVARVIFPKRFYVSDGLITVHLHTFMDDPLFKTAYAKGVQYLAGPNPGTQWRIKVAMWCAENAPAGIFVECGTNEGITMAAIMATQKHHNRAVYLCDCWDIPDYDGLFDVVKTKFGQWPNVHLHKGYMPDAAEHLPPSPIGFLHLDMNDATVEVATLRRLHGHLIKGAIILLDDYNFAGFMESHVIWNATGMSILPLPTGQGLIIWK